MIELLYKWYQYLTNKATRTDGNRARPRCWRVSPAGRTGNTLVLGRVNDHQLGTHPDRLI